MCFRILFKLGFWVLVFVTFFEKFFLFIMWRVYEFILYILLIIGMVLGIRG